MESGFEFLRGVNEKLYDDACKAEKYLEMDDAPECNTRLGQMNEKIVNDILKRNGISGEDIQQDYNEVNIYNKINYLNKNNIIPGKTIAQMDRVRFIRNHFSTSHEMDENVTKKDVDAFARESMKCMREIAGWYVSEIKKPAAVRTQPSRPAAPEPRITSSVSLPESSSSNLSSGQKSRRRRRYGSRGVRSNVPLVLTVIYGIISAVLLFIHRWDILELALHGIRKTGANSGFLFDIIFPCVVLGVPWLISCLIVLALLYTIWDHKPLKILFIIAAVCAIAYFGCEQVKPGLVGETFDRVKQMILPEKTPEAETSGRTAAETPAEKQAAEPATEKPAETVSPEPAAEVPAELETAADAQAPEAEADSREYRMIKEQGTMLRAEKNVNAQVVGRIARNDIVRALDDQTEQQNGHAWRKVRTADGRTGWVIADFLEPVQADPADSAKANAEAAPARVGEASAVFAGITFTVSKKDNVHGTLRVESNATETWGFGPWMGANYPITLIRTDGTEETALISKSGIFFQYQTTLFERGMSFTFPLEFQGKSDADWDRIEFNLSYLMNSHDILIRFGTP